MQKLTSLLLVLIAACATVPALAFPQIFNDWQAYYSAGSTAGDNAGCQLCHANANGGSPWNSYGFDILVALGQAGCDGDASGTVSNDEAFACVEFLNSDDDLGQSDNVTEILANAQPGWSLGECNTHYTDFGTTVTGQPAPADIGAVDPAGTGPLTDCPTDPGGGDPGDATIVTVRAGESIQSAIDAVGVGSTILIEPGVYTEAANATNALNVTKSGLTLIGLTNDAGERVVIEPSGDQRNGIVVVPAARTDCLSCHESLAPPFTLWPGVAPNTDFSVAIQGFEIRNVTIRNFTNNGLFTERVDDFAIVNVHSENNTNYGIFPTLSSNGLVQHSSAVGADDSGIWVETSTHVRVVDNVVSGNVNGFEISNSDHILLENNTSFGNSVGVSLFVLTDLVDERPGANKIMLRNNWIYDNNKVNTGTPGSLLADLPRGIGVLVLGVDNSTVRDNMIEDNDFSGIAIADYCLGVQGTAFDCTDNPPPPEFDSVPERNRIIGNTLINNGTNADPSPFAPFAADITLFVPGDYGNCFLDNVLQTFIAITQIRTCSPLGTPYLISGPTASMLFDPTMPSQPFNGPARDQPLRPVRPR